MNKQNKEIIIDGVNKQVILQGSYCNITMKQYLELDGFALDTFTKRLKWLLTGKVGTFVKKDGETKTITSKDNS